MGKFNTKVAGVSHQSPQGHDCQSIIAKHVKEGMSVLLVPEPDNEHDLEAVAVWIETKGFFRTKRYHIGFLPRGTGLSSISDQLQRGKSYSATVKNVTGGGRGKSYGVNLTIEL